MAAIDLGFSALLNVSTFLIGYLPKGQSSLEDMGSEISTFEWYGLMTGGLLLQLPLLVGAVAAVLCLRSLCGLASSALKPSA